jgi:energy-converting hydrogenase A subunit M
MIVIDGRESALTLSNYANLEDVLIKIIEEEKLEDRIVTDVLVDDEAFSELYPHQAEDIEASGISRVEIRTISLDQMAGDVVVELPKVIDIMAGGSRAAAALLRRAELAEGLEVLQDVVGVSRELLNTIYVLRCQYSSGTCAPLEEMSDTLGDLLGEIADVMSNEDWVLVADLLEYEYLPACEGWRKVITSIEEDVLASKKAA